MELEWVMERPEIYREFKLEAVRLIKEPSACPMCRLRRTWRACVAVDDWVKSSPTIRNMRFLATAR